MPSKSVLRRKASAATSISVPDPRAYRAILATHDKRVRWLEATIARELFDNSPAWRARAKIEEALEYLRTEGPSGDERQDRLLDALLRARQARQRAITEAYQGRLFPKGPRATEESVRRSMLIDLSDVVQRSQRYEEHMAASKHEAEERSHLATIEAKVKANRLRHIRDTIYDALKADVMHFGKTSAGGTDRNILYWRRKPQQGRGENAWVEFFQNDDALHDLYQDTLTAQRARRAEWEAQQKAADAEERKAKLAAAKQPLPKGYVVEKGRGGYHFTTPTGEIHPRGRYGLKTKGEAVTAAIAHHQNQRSR
jgi:hypothetical protein